MRIYLGLIVFVSVAALCWAERRPDLDKKENVELLQTPVSYYPHRTRVRGIYYLRDDDPNGLTDEGSLLKSPPKEDEVTFCGAFILFRFDQPGDYSGIYRISNIYYHLWQKAPELPVEGVLFDIGYSTSNAHNDTMDESIEIDTEDNITVVDNYRLVQAMQFPDPEIAVFEGDGIFEFTIKSYGNGPRIRTFPEQHSFVILNVEDDATLQRNDSDCDQVNDYDELFVHFTNPFDRDTDDDGAMDYEEVNGATHGYQDSDPNDYTDTTDYRREYHSDNCP